LIYEGAVERVPSREKAVGIALLQVNTGKVPHFNPQPGQNGSVIEVASMSLVRQAGGQGSPSPGGLWVELSPSASAMLREAYETQ